MTLAGGHREAYDEYSRVEPIPKDGPSLSKLGSNSTAELHPKSGIEGDARPNSMPPASVMTRLILIMVWRKLIRNPNTYSSLIGIIWSLVSFRFSFNSSIFFLWCKCIDNHKLFDVIEVGLKEYT